MQILQNADFDAIANPTARNRTVTGRAGRGQPRAVPPERDAEMLARRAAGETWPAIATAMNLPLPTVEWRAKWLRQRAHRGAAPPTKWHPSTDLAKRLIALWAERLPTGEPLTTTEIGRRLGESKNSVISASRRLDLPERPSPVKRDGPCTRKSKQGAERRAAAALPPLASATPSPAKAPQAPAYQPPPVLEPAPSYGRIIECCWPIGNPGTRSFRFCDAPSKPGKPYCPTHAKKAYVPTRGHAEPLGGGASVLARHQ